MRARRNANTTGATLPSERERRLELRGKRLPKLPAKPDGGEWDERTLDWWREAMRSPQSKAYTTADRHALMLSFYLVDEFYTELADERSARGRVGRLTMLATEIRQSIARFGLTPRDRLSLHWHIPPDTDAPARTQGRQAPARITDYRSRLGAEDDDDSEDPA